MATRPRRIEEDPHIADILALRPSDAALAIQACIKARENVCVIGPPGCGKSSIIRQSAMAVGHEFICSNPPLEDPTEPGGLPWIAADHTHAKKVLFAQAYRALHCKVPTTWHWEDFGQGENAVQKAYMQWAEAREVDGNRLPDHVSITMATNRRTDKAGVSGILEPVKGRFTLIQMRSDIDDFCNNLFVRGVSEYRLSENAITMGCAFLRFRTPLLNAFNPTQDMTNSPTERNWVHGFRVTDFGMKKHIEHAMCAGRVGQGAASEFMAFVEMYRNMPSLDAILADPKHAPIPGDDQISARYAVSVGLAGKANPQNFERIKTYAERMEKASIGEFAVLLARDSIRRDPKIQNTRSWIELSTGPVGQLMQGRGE